MAPQSGRRGAPRVILKLGGSVLTAEEEETLSDRFDEVLSAVAEARCGDLILVHGAGSFGHPHAEHHGVNESAGTRDACAVDEVHGAVTRLNGQLVEALNSKGANALPVHPLSCAWRDAELFVETGAVEALRREGFTPVLHGDLVASVGEGATVVSGDEIAVELGARFGERVGMCAQPGGVLDADGERIERVTSLQDVPDLSNDDTPDVTRGIHGKVDRLLSLDDGGRVFGPDELGEWLAGEDVGTHVRRDR